MLKLKIIKIYNFQEITVLKRKIEEFELEKDQLKSKIVEYQKKIASKSTKPATKTLQSKVIIKYFRMNNKQTEKIIHSSFSLNLLI